MKKPTSARVAQGLVIGFAAMVCVFLVRVPSRNGVLIYGLGAVIVMASYGFVDSVNEALVRPTESE